MSILCYQSDENNASKMNTRHNNLVRKLFLLFASSFIISICGFCQGRSYSNAKQPVDTSEFFNWQHIESWPYPAISNDGKYVLYSIKNLPVKGNTLMIQSLGNNHENIHLTGVQKAEFTNDSKQVVFQSKDSLYILSLENGRRKFVAKISFFKLFRLGGIEWFVYSNSSDKELVLLNMTSNAQVNYKGVIDHLLSDSGRSLVVLTSEQKNSNTVISVKWINLFTNDMKVIWEGSSVTNLTIDQDGKQIAFLAEPKPSNYLLNKIANEKSIFYYKVGDEKAAELNIDRSKLISKDLLIDGISHFGKNNSKFFIKLKQKPSSRSADGVRVNIWSYTDVKLQSQQLNQIKIFGEGTYLAAIDIGDPSNFIYLQKENEIVNDMSNDFVVLTSRRGDESENYWNKESAGVASLVSTKNGERKLVRINRATISPSEKYVIGYGPGESRRDLFVYDIVTGTTKNITSSLPIPNRETEKDMLWPMEDRQLDVAGWLENDMGVLIYDSYDIWVVDPSGVNPAVNLTNGRWEKLRFRLVGDYSRSKMPIQTGDTLLLSSFNKLTKQAGFYKVNLNNRKELQRLFSGDYTFEMIPYNQKNYNFPLKARNANVYLVRRESSSESPNIFYTKNFKTFTSVSNVYPEKIFNWYKAEVVSFTNTSDQVIQGILYKPEDFDFKKKYPLIINYYDKKSDLLNQYQHPVPSNGAELDIPWFTSHGYVVFISDIKYKIGSTGESVLESVSSAVNHLSKYTWIDKKHIGIQGHSFGGYETNYLVTHTGLFAAAMTSCGISNPTSEALNLWGSQKSKLEYWETRGGRLATTPWEKPDVYIKNSPIYYVGNVTTPLLLMANRNDQNVHFEEGLQFFTALRRSGKKAWMLEYDHGGHGVSGEDYKDYLIRMTQFFDHYLKDSAAPRWMMNGIPATDKGIYDGFELVKEKDPQTGKWITPGKGLLTAGEEKKVEALKKKRTVTITLN